MPLKKGCGLIGENIREMKKSGRPVRVATAAALRTDAESCPSSHVKPRRRSDRKNKGRRGGKR